MQNYVEKPYQDTGSFIQFAKNAIDMVQVQPSKMHHNSNNFM